MKSHATNPPRAAVLRITLVALAAFAGSGALTGCDPEGGQGRPVGPQAWKRVDFEELVRASWEEATAGHALEGTQVDSVGPPLEKDGKIYVTVIAQPAEGDSISQAVSFSGEAAEWTMDPLPE